MFFISGLWNLTKTSPTLHNWVETESEHFRSKPSWERAAYVFWLLGPLILLVERTPADLWLSSLALAFLFKSWSENDFSWIKTPWVSLAIIFLIVCLISAYFSAQPLYSIGETIAWARFPLFAAAVVFWLARSRESVYLMLVAMTLGMIIIAGISLVETFVVGHVNNRLSWPYGDLVPGNYHAKACMPALVVLIALAISSSARVALPSVVITLISLVSSFLTGERINFFLRIFCGGLAILSCRPNWKRLALIFGTTTLLALAMVMVFPSLMTRFFDDFLGQLPLSSASPYYRAMGPGILAFLEAPILGVGPANLRDLCSGIIENIEHFDCHPHPHNFYIQMAGETGVIGLIVGTLFVLAINWTCIKPALKYRSNVIVATMWVVPFGFFWPISSTADFFGQWNNIFMWSALSIALAGSNPKLYGIESYEVEKSLHPNKDIQTGAIFSFCFRITIVFVAIWLLLYLVSPYQICKRSLNVHPDKLVQSCMELTFW